MIIGISSGSDVNAKNYLGQLGLTAGMIEGNVSLGYVCLLFAGGVNYDERKKEEFLAISSRIQQQYQREIEFYKNRAHIDLWSGKNNTKSLNHTMAYMQKLHFLQNCDLILREPEFNRLNAMSKDMLSRGVSLKDITSLLMDEEASIDVSRSGLSESQLEEYRALSKGLRMYISLVEPVDFPEVTRGEDKIKPKVIEKAEKPSSTMVNDPSGAGSEAAPKKDHPRIAALRKSGDSR